MATKRKPTLLVKKAVKKVLQPLDYSLYFRKSSTCCGVYELTSIHWFDRRSKEDGIKQVLRYLVHTMSLTGKLAVYYGVNNTVCKVLEKLGFAEIYSFTNPNTQNTVRVMARTI